MNSQVDLVKKTTACLRKAMGHWKAHENAACRRDRDRANELYQQLSKSEREQIPQNLRVWLRYRSEKYFGKGLRGNGKDAPLKQKKKAKTPSHAVSSLRMNTPVGQLVVLASKKGICGLYFGHRIEKSTLPREDSSNRDLKKARTQLEEYFEGNRTVFDLRLDFKGSEFQRDVWRQLLAIPFGETRSYGDLAHAMGNPGAVRAVGAANGANPISIIVPCHRVIGKDGSLTGFGGGLEIKTKLLALEGSLAEKTPELPL